MCSANLLNWLGNWVLIYGKLGLPALGSTARRCPTLVARIAMAAALIGLAWHYERQRGHPLFQHWARPSLIKLKQLVRLGLAGRGTDRA